MFLSIVHLRELRCALCGDLLAQAGARSFVVDRAGNPVPFEERSVPQRMRLDIVCANGHVNGIEVPDDASAEEVLSTPDEAPVGKDAVLPE